MKRLEFARMVQDIASKCDLSDREQRRAFLGEALMLAARMADKDDREWATDHIVSVSRSYV